MNPTFPTQTQSASPRFPAVQKVAWVRVGALGDLLVGLASLVETHEAFPHARVAVIGPKLWREILSPSLFPWIDSIAVIERKGTLARLFRPNVESWEDTGEEIQLVELLRGYGAAINTQIGSHRYGLQAWRAGVPLRFGSAPWTMGWVYSHPSPDFGKDPLIHERDAALLLLEDTATGLSRFLKSTSKNRAILSASIERSSLVRKWRERGLPPGKPADLARAKELTGREPGSYILVNPTSSRREKAWPSSKFHELMLQSRESMKASGIEVLVLGSPSETDWLKEVAGDEFRVVQPPTIRDLQDVLSGSRGLLTNTSSVQFVAAMTGTPTLTLMGRARPEIWGPLGPQDQIVRGRPPAELAHDIFLQEKAGYESIEVSEVLPGFLALPTRPRVR